MVSVHHRLWGDVSCIHQQDPMSNSHFKDLTGAAKGQSENDLINEPTSVETNSISNISEHYQHHVVTHPAGPKWRNTVFGYIREHSEVHTIFVPDVVQFLCLDYYWLNEKFVIKYFDDDWERSALILEEEGRLVSNHSPGHHRGKVAWGNIRIDDRWEGISEYKWILQVSRDRTIKYFNSILGIGLRTEDSGLEDFVAIWKGFVHKIKSNGCRIGARWELQEDQRIFLTLNVKEKMAHFQIKRPAIRKKGWAFGNRKKKQSFMCIEGKWKLPLEKGYMLNAEIENGYAVRLIDFSIVQN